MPKMTDEYSVSEYGYVVRDGTVVSLGHHLTAWACVKYQDRLRQRTVTGCDPIIDGGLLAAAALRIKTGIPGRISRTGEWKHPADWTPHLSSPRPRRR